MHTVMVTGDHHTTALAVAQVTGMLSVQRRRIMIAMSEDLHLPTDLSREGAPATRPKVNSLQLARTRSAVPMDSNHLAEMKSQQNSGSSRSLSFSLIELGALNSVSGAKLSSKPLVPKPALQSASPHKASPRQPGQIPASRANSGPAQITGSSDSLTHARSSEPFALHQLLAQTDADNLADLQQAAPAESTLPKDELIFLMGEGGRMAPLPRGEAVAMIAMGHQCIITGRVFEHLVQHADPALLETVLHNVAVCARMKSHQKAQLVQLLGSQGLTVSSTRKLKVNRRSLFQCLQLAVECGCGTSMCRLPHVNLPHSEVRHSQWVLVLPGQ